MPHPRASQLKQARRRLRLVRSLTTVSYLAFAVIVAWWLLTPRLGISRPMGIAAVVVWLVTLVASFLLLG
jgi:fatty acid desaturase